MAKSMPFFAGEMEKMEVEGRRKKNTLRVFFSLSSRSPRSLFFLRFLFRASSREMPGVPLPPGVAEAVAEVKVRKREEKRNERKKPMEGMA